VELTESLAMRDVRQTVVTLNALNEIGVSIAIDDFGTGYSSLAYLRRFPVDFLKIDRTFVHDIGVSDDGAAIARAIISMAHSLQLSVIGEGVETAQQFDFLCRHGCEEVQGFLFAKALPPDEVVPLIAPGYTATAAAVYPEVAAIRASG
jgi:EAL domain-containing protein (putative c-di-GMP-specific phosphodiesterase class I)